MVVYLILEKDLTYDEYTTVIGIADNLNTAIKLCDKSHTHVPYQCDYCGAEWHIDIPTLSAIKKVKDLSEGSFEEDYLKEYSINLWGVTTSEILDRYESINNRYR